MAGETQLKNQDINRKRLQRISKSERVEMCLQDKIYLHFVDQQVAAIQVLCTETSKRLKGDPRPSPTCHMMDSWSLKQVAPSPAPAIVCSAVPIAH